MKRRLISLIFIALAAFSLLAQKDTNNAIGFQPQKLYDFSSIDSVSVQDGNLMIAVPLGNRYAVGPSLSYQFTAVYNGRMWDYEEYVFVDTDERMIPQFEAFPNFRSNAGVGWRVTLGRLLAPTNGTSQSPGDERYQWIYEDATGAEHAFSSQPYPVSTGLTNNATVMVTRDASALRMIKINDTTRVIEFPNGDRHRFDFEEQPNAWRLKEIKDRFDNWIHIAYVFGDNYDDQWTVTDSRGRTHTVGLTGFSQMADGVERGQNVDWIDVQAFDGATVRYDFVEELIDVDWGCFNDGNPERNQPSRAKLPLLTGILQPDGTKFAFTYHTAPVVQCDQGAMKSMTLPTGGVIEYTYRKFAHPPADPCDVINPLQFPVGIDSRTIKDGSTARTWNYVQFVGPHAAGITYPLAPCGSDSQIQAELPHFWTRTSVLSPVDASDQRVRTDSYFNAYNEPPSYATIDNPLVPIARELAGGVPITAGVPPEATAKLITGPANTPSYPADGSAADPEDSTLRLGTQIYAGCDSSGDCTDGTLLRSSWFRYDATRFGTRMGTTRTRFHDDDGCNGTCWIEVANLDQDGAGHYRTMATTSNFPLSHTRTSYTAFPSWSADDVMNRDRKWLTSVFTETTQTEVDPKDAADPNDDVTETAREQFCFNANTGFLERHRVLKGSTAGPLDIVNVYTADAEGQVKYASTYGGDVQAVDPGTNLCALTLPASPWYKIENSYDAGLLRWTRHIERNSSQERALLFKDVDRDLDPSTGVVTAVRDPALVTTSYTYDALPARIRTMTLPGGAKTTYTFTNASGSAATAPFTTAKVALSTETIAEGTPKAQYEFDGLGRVLRESTLGTAIWSAVEKSYDEMGHLRSVSQPEDTGAQPPAGTLTAAHKTTYGYDAFGRVTRITAPDANETTISYEGVRTKTTTVSVAIGGENETPVSRTETFDPFGRLLYVSEAGGSVITTYDYDAGNRIKSVTMADGNTTQSRAFVYDHRGFLLEETHPELGANGNGTTKYENYDPRGNPGRRITGSVNLTHLYDSAGRLTDIKETVTGNPLEQFVYDAFPQCDGSECYGKLAAAARWNYVPDLGTIAVTETYQYGAAGQPERRDSAVGSGSNFAGQDFKLEQSYTSLGNVAATTYPCRSVGGTCNASDRTAPAVTYGYTNGLLSSVSPWATSITYRPNGTIEAVVHGSGTAAINEVWSADPHGLSRPSAIRARNAFGTELWSTGTYAFDGSGNIKKIGNTDYRYDALGRLTEWTARSGASFSTTRRMYDSFGNFTGEFYRSCGAFCAETGLLPLAVNGTTNHYADSTYDALGNVLGDGRRTYTYDPLGMATGTDAGGRQFRYIYTADDERIAVVERVPGAGGIRRNRTTWAVRGFDNKLLSSWTDDSTSGTRIFTWKEDQIWRGGMPLANITPGGTKHYVLDHLGSPRYVTDASGQTLGTQSFSPFGSGGTSNGGPLQFAGMERDAATVGDGVADLPDYVHARYYDAYLGRFLSVDPVLDVKQALSLPQAWNRYSYVRNNPVRFTDPTGKYTCSGSQDECRAIEASLSIVRAAAAEAARTRQPGAAALNSVVAFYGKAGVNNGVSVVVAATGVPGATGKTETIGSKTKITVDKAYLNNILTTGKGYVDLAKTAAHEGDHGVQGLANTSLQATRSFQDHLFAERSAWRTETYINSTLGLSDAIGGGIWQVGVGWNPAILESTARRNALANCAAIGGCTP